MSKTCPTQKVNNSETKRNSLLRDQANNICEKDFEKAVFYKHRVCIVHVNSGIMMNARVVTYNHTWRPRYHTSSSVVFVAESKKI